MKLARVWTTGCEGMRGGPTDQLGLAQVAAEREVPTWVEMTSKETAALSSHLASHEEAASIKQYPAFNEHFRRAFTTPIVVRCVGHDARVIGCACVISLQAAGFRCAAVIDGPVMFEGATCTRSAAEALVRWFRSRGYAFVRMSHRAPEVLEAFATLPETTEGNPLPFIPRYGGECVINLVGDDAELLAGFQRVARRNIRDAHNEGWVVKWTSDFARFQELWPILQRRAREKGYRVDHLSTYEAMFRLSPRNDLIRLYAAYYGEDAFFPVLILREHSEAYALIAALDTKALRKRQSPCCLVHWTAMRDYRDMGCRRYNIGGPAGNVLTFKEKFRPTMTQSPATITIVLKPWLYRTYIRVLRPSITYALQGVRVLAGR